MMTKSLLLTGFEPFDGFSVNPSGEIAKLMDDMAIGDFKITGTVLPLDYNSALTLVKEKISQINPEVILACGQANRSAITIERIAINAVNLYRKDNYGNVPRHDIIVKDGPAAYFTSFDPHPLVEAVRKAGIPAEVSYHAGTYGCNWLLFNIMHWIQTGVLKARATFVHIPPLPIQAMEKHSTTLPTMKLETIQQALQIIIKKLNEL